MEDLLAGRVRPGCWKARARPSHRRHRRQRCLHTHLHQITTKAYHSGATNRPPHPYAQAKTDKPEGSSFVSKGSKMAARLNLFAGSSGEGSGGLTLSPPPAAKRAAEGGAAADGGAEAGPMCVSPRPGVEEGGRRQSAGGSGVFEEAAGSELPVRQASGAVGEATEELGQLQLGEGAAEGGSQQQAPGAEAWAEVAEDDWGDFASS